jgi:hypothetical protein
MKTINLLDLDNYILNIIGDYVKKDNECRKDEEEDLKNRFYDESFERKPQIYKYEIGDDSRSGGEALYSQLFKHVVQKRKLKNMWKRKK